MTSPATTVTPAAVEMITELSQLWLTVARVAREPALVEPLMDAVCCRMLDLLEVYVRRVVEMIIAVDSIAWAGASTMKVSMHDALTLSPEALRERLLLEDAPRVASSFEDTRKLLGRFLRQEPFTKEQVTQLLQLKAIRNAIVHNNGLVDQSLVQAIPELTLGTRVRFQHVALHVSMAVLLSIQHIDAALVQRYPDLGQGVPEEQKAALMALFAGGLDHLSPTNEELEVIHDVARLVDQADWPFAAPPLSAVVPISAHGTYWVADQRENAWQLTALDGRQARPFSSLAEAQAWISSPGEGWAGAELAAQSEDEVVLTLPGGLQVRWPRSLWEQNTDDSSLEVGPQDSVELNHAA